MTTPTVLADWRQFAAEAPTLATAVRARFEANTSHVLATLRRDGSPRVSGIEVDFHGGDLVVGSMWRAVKARDLQRGGRFALHANPTEGGDAKLSGRAVEVADPEERRAYTKGDEPPGPFHLFRLLLDEAVLTSVVGDRLVIESWHPGAPPRRMERR